MSNSPVGVSGCQLCRGGAGKETCFVVDLTGSMKGQVNYYLNNVNHDGTTMSEGQIRTTLDDLRSKIELCQNGEEVKKALDMLSDYLQKVDSAK